MLIDTLQSPLARLSVHPGPRPLFTLAPPLFTLARPLFTRLRDARRILVAGAGGFDLYDGLPPALALSGQARRPGRVTPH
jgi:hypothetical protein